MSRFWVGNFQRLYFSYYDVEIPKTQKPPSGESERGFYETKEASPKFIREASLISIYSGYFS